MGTAKTAVILDKRKIKKDNTFPIKLRVTFERKQKYYSIPFDYSVNDFERIMYGRKLSDKEKINKQIILKCENKAALIIQSLAPFTWKLFEKKYYVNDGAKDSIQFAFTEYANELREAGRIGTAVSYECAQKSIDKYYPDAKFSDVTPEFLRDYEKRMLENNSSITTVGIYLRSLRTIFNNAIEEGSITKEYYPFGKKKYEIPTGNNIKKALTLNDIALLYNYQPEKETSEATAKDFWLFMYLCNGMNMKDVCLLKYKNIKGDKIFFERAKTVRTKRKVESIEIIINSDVERIISIHGNKDKNPENFIFPILQKGLTPERERQLIQQIIHVVNSHMKNIASKLGITSKTTTYAARHSFATILQRSGASTSFISDALGHGSEQTTRNYLAGFEDESKREINKALLAFKKII